MTTRRRDHVARAAAWVLGIVVAVTAVSPLLPFAAADLPHMDAISAGPTSTGWWRHGFHAGAGTAARTGVDGWLESARVAIFDDGEIGPVCGTDELGRCLLARVVAGLRMSLGVAVLAALVSGLLGVAFGMVSGWCGGMWDAVIMRSVDAVEGLPLVFLVIFLQGFLRARANLGGTVQTPGERSAVFFALLGCVTWLTTARMVRAQTLSLRQRPFVLAATALGATTPAILWRHLLPNLMPTVLVALTLTVPRIVLFESFLSFLGMGVEAPDVSLGIMARAGLDSVSAVDLRPWPIVVPAAALATVLLALNILGDAARDAADPRSAHR